MPGKCYIEHVGYWYREDVGDVECWGNWDIHDAGWRGCGMFEMLEFGDWDARYVGCSGCGMFGMWNVGSVGCSGYGMWDVCRDVGCWFTKWRKFKIDEMSYSKSQCRATYYVTKNKPSKYPYVTYTKMQVMFWIKVWYCPAISESAKLSITQEICLF